MRRVRACREDAANPPCVRASPARQAAYKYSRELKGFDKDVAGHKGALTQDVVNRASQGVVLYIDVSLRKLFEP